jgi:ribosomal protein L21E
VDSSFSFFFLLLLPLLKRSVFFLLLTGRITAVQGNTAQVKLLESGKEFTVSENNLETVIPQLGRKVRIVKGQYHGCEGTLLDIDQKKFSVKVKVDTQEGETAEVWKEYEEVCKFE